MATSYYPDFAKLSQYDKTSSVEAVRFGADTPLTEMDLNEMQLIQIEKRRQLVRQIFGDGLSKDGTIEYVDGSLIIENKTAFIDGYMVYIDSVSVPVADGESVYLNVIEKNSVGINDRLMKYGNENGQQIENYILDARYGQEITRRMALSYIISTSQVADAKVLKIGTVIDSSNSSSGSSEMEWSYAETSAGGSSGSFDKFVGTKEDLDNKLALEDMDGTMVFLKDGKGSLPNFGGSGNNQSYVDFVVMMKKVEDTGRIVSQIVNGAYEGRDLNDVFDVEISDYADCFEWIKDRIDKGFLDGLYPADFISFNLSDGELIEAQIAGINPYFGGTDQSLGNHIDFISRDCLVESAKWNTSSTNNGNADYPWPYMCSNMKNYLQDTIYPKLPENLKMYISSKRALTEKRYSSSARLEDSTDSEWNDIGKLWLPSEYEVTGSVVLGSMPYSGEFDIQYPIFSRSKRAVIKRSGKTGSSRTWWLRTAVSKSGENICSVYNNGCIKPYGASSSLGIPLCFRITADSSDDTR